MDGILAVFFRQDLGLPPCFSPLHFHVLADIERARSSDSDRFLGFGSRFQRHAFSQLRDFLRSGRLCCRGVPFGDNRLLDLRTDFRRSLLLAQSKDLFEVAPLGYPLFVQPHVACLLVDIVPYRLANLARKFVALCLVAALLTVDDLLNPLLAQLRAEAQSVFRGQVGDLVPAPSDFDFAGLGLLERPLHLLLCTVLAAHRDRDRAPDLVLLVFLTGLVLDRCEVRFRKLAVHQQGQQSLHLRRRLLQSQGRHVDRPGQARFLGNLLWTHPAFDLGLDLPVDVCIQLVRNLLHQSCSIGLTCLFSRFKRGWAVSDFQ